MIIRVIELRDAEKFLKLRKKLDRDSDFLLLEAGERKMTVEEQKKIIGNIKKTENKNVFVVEEGGNLIGFLTAFGGGFKRNYNTIYIVIAILQGYIGKGIGTRLFEYLDEWVRKSNFHKLELSVMAHNQRAINLYKKLGFEVEGLRKEALFVNDKYVDEYYMGKIL